MCACVARAELLGTTTRVVGELNRVKCTGSTKSRVKVSLWRVAWLQKLAAMACQCDAGISSLGLGLSRASTPLRISNTAT
ncbi:hypothetical protein PF010_g30045 [Phytophthora fragariae]|uniref:Uncharacterized protein n=1 Tax=Phytophthora fragariae TaxID=53985 RepID=A0A6A3PTF6_9STRA|nr:hypothetical protein PF009_g24904 [Phytophthora fragariae]KAE9059582.1 hypothetical protein PF007_g30905 [Phytophthora fragariae]KAE9060869.1 hypothetical protein PF010_g30045 [Phytophthora fragariae]KAE9277955.1 hypothetical protein PF008_g28734 [Phytophthora fragariae]